MVGDNLALAFQTHDYHKRIMIDGNILMSVGLDKVYIEIFTINQRHLALSLTVIFRFVFGIHFIIDGILGLLCMEFAGISLGVTAVEVVYAIGDIAGLLNLGKKIACADSVDTSCGKEEKYFCTKCYAGLL